MKHFQNRIEDITKEQFEYSKGVNVFNYVSPLPRFSAQTKKAIHAVRTGRLQLDETALQRWSVHAAEQFMHEVCRVNQYANFSSADTQTAAAVYRDLWRDIVDDAVPIEVVEDGHRQRLQEFLHNSNEILYTYNTGENVQARHFVCAEYTAQMQLAVLRIRTYALAEPVLDIGCGADGNLVEYLRDCGVEAYGIDRMHRGNTYIQQGNWLECDFGREKWGAVIAHLSFTGHLLHHAGGGDSLAAAYVQKYREILLSLKSGGEFYCAPALPFLEENLSSSFSVKRWDVNKSFAASCITKT